MNNDIFINPLQEKHSFFKRIKNNPNKKIYAALIILVILICMISMFYYFILSNNNKMPSLTPETTPTSAPTYIPNITITITPTPLPILDTYEFMPVHVLVLKYFPLKNGDSLDPNIVGMDDELSSIRSKVYTLTEKALQALTTATSYHGYKTANKPYLQYTVFDSKEYLNALPVSNNKVPWHANDPNPTYRPDYYQMMKDINICEYVDNKKVSQVWVWGYHYGGLEPVEANQSTGTNSQRFWNYSNYGDISNSEQINDLPTCKRTYTLYNYDYNRQLGEILENHGHQIEEVFKYIDADLWSKFRDPYGETEPIVNSCGWIHSGPNSKTEYQPGWANETILKSNCEDWRPDGTGMVKDINCHTWYGILCLDNGGVEFKVWWMQNIPGYNNNLLYNGRKLRNWWEFYGDFDSAIGKGKVL